MPIKWHFPHDRTSLFQQFIQRHPQCVKLVHSRDIELSIRGFALVERSILSEVPAEQDLGDRVAQPSAAATGQVLGAEYLLQVVITDYETGTKEAGGGAIGALLKVPLIGGVGIKKEGSQKQVVRSLAPKESG